MLTQEYLTQIYGNNEPIFAYEFERENRPCLEELRLQGVLTQFLDSYYLKNKDFTQIFFEERYIVKKFITNGSSVYGYKSGKYLKSIMGIPHISTRERIIYSSRVEEREEYNMAGFHNIILKAPFKIDSMNADIIQFLDLFNNITYKEAIDNREKIIERLRERHYSSLQRNMYFSLLSTEALQIVFNGQFYYEFEDFDW